MGYDLHQNISWEGNPYMNKRATVQNGTVVLSSWGQDQIQMLGESLSDKMSIKSSANTQRYHSVQHITEQNSKSAKNNI